jgi:hypothetical protein
MLPTSLPSTLKTHSSATRNLTVQAMSKVWGNFLSILILSHWHRLKWKPPLESHRTLKSILHGSNFCAQWLSGLQLLRNCHTCCNCYFSFCGGCLKSSFFSSTGAHCVAHPSIQNWTKKNQNMLVWLSKMVFAQHFSTWWAEASKRHNRT